MENKKAQKEIIKLLIENEKAVEALYRTYAKKLPIFSNFWIEIAEEEASHAAWIETLYGKMDTGLVDFAENRFPKEAISHNIDYLKKKNTESEKSEISLSQALESAVHMERGLLESKFFEIFKADSIDLQTIMEALRLGTQEHLRRVEELWAKEK